MVWFVDYEITHPCSAHKSCVTFSQLVFKTSFKWDFIKHKNGVFSSKWLETNTAKK